MKAIEECEGYKKLLKAVERDEAESPGGHDYRGKLAWVLERAKHYAEKTGLEAADILDAWEKDHTYWYMNYYQDCNQPLIKGDETMRIFESMDELKESVGKSGFRCPACGGVSSDPYECNTGKIINKKVCDWKSYGLFGCMGKGAHFFVKEKMKGETIFMPIAWEHK
jgi:hypothetical protein